MNIMNRHSAIITLAIITLTTSDTVVQVHRNVKQDGFHRDLKTVINFDIEKQILDKLKVSPCRILVKEYLPSGVYVDPYQLELLSTGYQVLIDGDIDIEAPEYSSPPVDVYIFTILSTDIISIELPIHIRYHRPSNTSSYSNLSIKNPHLYFHCSHLSDSHNSETLLAPCDNKNSSSCHWKRLLYPVLESVKFQVPVGIAWHNTIVTIMTLMTTTVGCTLLIWKMLISKPVNKKNH